MMSSLVRLVCLHAALQGALGITPSGEMSIRQSTTVVYVAPGGFGDDLPDESDTIYRKLVQPVGDVDGCSPEVPQLFPKNSQFYLLVARGNCTFAEKAAAAEAQGAKGVIIYNSLEGIYQGNDWADSSDYECDNGQAWVPESDVISPVYSAESNAAMPAECSASSLCASQTCIYSNATRVTTAEGNFSYTERQVCCAWDLYVTMGGDDDVDVGIPVAFVRMQDQAALSAFSSLDALTMDVMVYKRGTFAVDIASVLIWLIAVCTVGLGAVRAAEEDRIMLHAPSKSEARGERDYYTESDSEPVIDYSPAAFPRALSSALSALGRGGSGSGTGLGSGSKSGSGGGSGGGFGSVGAGAAGGLGGGARAQPLSTGSGSGSESESAYAKGYNSMSAAGAGASLGGGLGASLGAGLGLLSGRGSGNESDGERLPVFRVRGRIVHGEGAELPENSGNSMDITAWHAAGFVVISSGFLILLYFVDLYNFVSILYLASASLAVALVFALPLLRDLFLRLKDLRHGTTTPLAYTPIGEDVSLTDPSLLLAVLLGGACSAGWYWYKSSSWAWLLQDTLGVAVCILFLCSVRLPNLKVASVLLCLAFLYDVFFVFISPYVFSSSVMLQVATGSTTTHDDENFCEKYPSDEDCQDSSLPMMLVVPTFSSYLSSESILGLGDIVLPGLLLAWCARYDMRRHGTLQSEKASQGFFPMALLGYSAGLMLANLAVDYFDAGQPALLYIVPLTLGPVLFRTNRGETLTELWLRLPSMKTVALPLDREEQERLLSSPDVVSAEASWTEQHKNKIITLSGAIAQLGADGTPLLVQGEGDAEEGMGMGAGAGAGLGAGMGAGEGGGKRKKKRKTMPGTGGGVGPLPPSSPSSSSSSSSSSFSSSAAPELAAATPSTSTSTAAAASSLSAAPEVAGADVLSGSDADGAGGGGRV